MLFNKMSTIVHPGNLSRTVNSVVYSDLRLPGPTTCSILGGEKELRVRKKSLAYEKDLLARARRSNLSMNLTKMENQIPDRYKLPEPGMGQRAYNFALQTGGPLLNNILYANIQKGQTDADMVWNDVVATGNRKRLAIGTGDGSDYPERVLGEGSATTHAIENPQTGMIVSPEEITELGQGTVIPSQDIPLDNPPNAGLWMTRLTNRITNSDSLVNGLTASSILFTDIIQNPLVYEQFARRYMGTAGVEWLNSVIRSLPGMSGRVVGQQLRRLISNPSVGAIVDFTGRIQNIPQYRGNNRFARMFSTLLQFLLLGSGVIQRGITPQNAGAGIQIGFNNFDTVMNAGSNVGGMLQATGGNVAQAVQQYTPYVGNAVVGSVGSVVGGLSNAAIGAGAMVLSNTGGRVRQIGPIVQGVVNRFGEMNRAQEVLQTGSRMVLRRTGRQPNYRQ
jgi:hypothetical protein